MAADALKLKQASAILQLDPKELQNLVQFGVLKPKRTNGAYFFDRDLLLAAKIAVYLKDVLGARASVLSQLIVEFTASRKRMRPANPNYVVFSLRFAEEEQPIKLGIPLRELERQIDARMSRATFYRDLPRGRKRRGWRKEFLESLAEAAKDLGEISKQEILRTLRNYRKERRALTITVAPEE